MTQHHHKPRKRFGQHFLADEQILLEMQQAIAPQATDHMIEIGPGLGVLTHYLVEHVACYEAIEIDRDLVSLLQENFSHHPHFTLHSQDVLTVDWFQLAGDSPLRVVGNLPYNISTPLIFALFDAIDVIRDMYFLLQKEVALRLAAEVGSSNYGRLSVMAQYFCEVNLLFDVDPEAFSPPPKVNSTFIEMVPRPVERRNAQNLKTLSTVVATAFNQRRKTLRNSLRELVAVEDFEQLGIDPKKRAQDLSVDDFVSIASVVKA